MNSDLKELPEVDCPTCDNEGLVWVPSLNDEILCPTCSDYHMEINELRQEIEKLSYWLMNHRHHIHSEQGGTSEPVFPMFMRPHDDDI